MKPKPEKIKSLPETKLRYGFPKNLKFQFCPVFWATLQFYPQSNFKIYVWRWCEPKLIFFWFFFYSDKKKIKFQKFCPHGFLWLWSIAKILGSLQLAWTVTPNKFWTKCLRCLIFLGTIVFHPYFVDMITIKP